MNIKKLIVANWKMNKTVQESQDFIKKFLSLKNQFKCGVVICPSFLCLNSMIDLCHKNNVKIGAQNCHFENEGAFTGEVSAAMLSDLNVDYVILGHSERRKYFNETDEMINKKVKSALKNKIIPIICVGETEVERNIGEEEAVVVNQIKSALKGLEVSCLKSIVIAYEPIWAIGTGKTAEPDDARKMFKAIRDYLILTYGNDVAESITLLYGGSMNENNAEKFLSIPNIDGGLIGGAALNPEKFLKIIIQAESTEE